MGVNGLTSSLNQFISVFNAGYDRLAPYALGLLITLIVIDVALTGAFTALGKHNAASLLERALFIGAWFWLTTNFPTLAKAFRDSLIAAGLIAGGRGAGDHTILSDPSRIAVLGFEVTEPILALAENSGVLDGGDMLFYWFCYCLLMLCFLLMAAAVYLAVIEFYFRLTISCILLPFGVFGPTRFIGEKPIGAIVSCGIKLMVLAFILSVGEPLLASHIRSNGEDPGFNGLWAALLSSGSMCLLTWMAPSIASGFMNGSPALSAGAAAQAAFTGATVAAGGAGLALAATRLAAGAAGAVGKAGAHVAGAAVAGGKAGASAAPAEAGRTGALAGGLVGAAKGAGGAVIGSVAGAARSAGAAAGEGPRAAFARGAQAYRDRAKSSEPLKSAPSEAEKTAALGGLQQSGAAAANQAGTSNAEPAPVVEVGPGGGFRGGSGSPPPAASDADSDPAELAQVARARPPSSTPPAPPPSAPPPPPPPPAAESVPPPIWADKTREHLLRLATEPRTRPRA